MNFKELSQETARLFEMNGTIADVQAVTGELARATQWTARAWVRIQLAKRDWEFLKLRLSFNTTAGQQAYTPVQMGADNLVSIDARSVTCWDAAIGRQDEQQLEMWDYEDVEEVYDFQVAQQHRPVVWALRKSDKSMFFGATPDKAYTVRGWYRRSAQELEANDDEPLIDSDLHMLIPYYAMLTYGNLEVAGERKAEAVEGIRDYWPALERRYLPDLQFEGPAA